MNLVPRWPVRVPDRWLPYAAALAAVMSAAGAAYSAKAGADARAQLRFQRFVQSTEHTIQQRLIAYVVLLRAGSGVFAANPETTRAQFRAFAERLDLARQYPGIQGIGPGGAESGPRPRAAVTTSASREPAPEVQLAGVRVVIVDDDQDTLDLIGHVLVRAGADVRRATSAAEAMAIMEAWEPHVLVSDIAMPVEDGSALIQRVRALPPDRGGLVPAIAVTAYGRMDDRIRSLASGYQQHLSKPVEPKELVAIVGRLTGRLT